MKTCKAFSQSVSSKLFVCFIVLFFQNPTTLYIHWFNILLFVGIYIYIHIQIHIHTYSGILYPIYIIYSIYICFIVCTIYTLLDLGLHHFHVLQGNHRKEGSLQQSRGPSGWMICRDDVTSFKEDCSFGCFQK